MSDTLFNIAMLLTVYKVVCLACGSLFCFFGYKLFLKGIYPSDGELGFEGFKTKLFLKRIGPGIFFALFGAVIICVTIFQPLSFEQNGDGGSVKTFQKQVKAQADSTYSDKPSLPDSIY